MYVEHFTFTCFATVHAVYKNALNICDNLVKCISLLFSYLHICAKIRWKFPQPLEKRCYVNMHAHYSFQISQMQFSIFPNTHLNENQQIKPKSPHLNSRISYIHCR